MRKIRVTFDMKVPDDADASNDEIKEFLEYELTSNNILKNSSNPLSKFSLYEEEFGVEFVEFYDL